MKVRGGGKVMECVVVVMVDNFWCDWCVGSGEMDREVWGSVR